MLIPPTNIELCHFMMDSFKIEQPMADKFRQHIYWQWVIIDDKGSFICLKPMDERISFKWGEVMKKKNYQIYLVIGIFIMIILIGTSFRNNQPMGVDQFNTDHHEQMAEEVIFSLETGTNIINSILTFPQQLWRLLTNPSEAQMRFFLRDGFFFTAEALEANDFITQQVERIGQNRDVSEEIYMLTWQPAEGFVRQSKLIHEQIAHDIPNATYINSEEPLVYIFNSHPHEMISSSFADLRVGEMDVVELSHEMALIFETFGIPSLVEDRDVRDVLHANGWAFANSYEASRIFLEERIYQYPTLQFFFDVHRDGVPWDLARIDVNGQPFARVLFVVGAENPAGYEENHHIANQIHHMLEERVPGISRGIMVSGGIGRNGIYNQDIAATLQLIEIGTVETTIEEAKNTMEILAEVLAEFIFLYMEGAGDQS